MSEASEGMPEDTKDSEIILILKDLTEVIDILHTEVSEMKKVLKDIKTDVEEIKGANHTNSQSYMHG